MRGSVEYHHIGHPAKAEKDWLLDVGRLWIHVEPRANLFVMSCAVVGWLSQGARALRNTLR